MPNPRATAGPPPSTPPVGQVVATEKRPSTPHQFHFHAVPDANVGIGTIVRVDAAARVVFGVVTDGYAYDEPETGVTDRRLFSAAVLRQLPEEPVQPVPPGPVHLATDVDVGTALRMESYAGPAAELGIPAGVYASGGLEAPVYIDPDFLLGPEAAHLNITGVSGLATKTSAVEFLLSSIFQRFPATKGSVASVCFNVKGPDLCFLDQPASLGAEDLRLYARLGLEPQAFSRVHYYAPHRPDGVNLNTLRSHDALLDNTEPLVWGLPEVLEYAEVLLNKDDVDAKADAFIDFLSERVVNREFEDPTLGKTFFVRSFADLDEFFRAIFARLEEGRGEIWRTHHVATIRKIRNRLGNISTRSKGLVTDDGEVSDLPWGAFEDRGLYVVDVAGIDPLAQDLVFARIVSLLREHLERRDLGVDHVIVFVDELNKYAPHDGPDSYVRKMLVDIAERGRYLGLVLFSAQQFRSQVQRRVVGNAGTTILGRMDGDEVSLPGYATMSPATRARLVALPKGELLVRHPHFTHPVFVRFPRPAMLSGREGVERFPPAAELPFEEAVARRLRQLDPSLASARIIDAVAGRREVDVRRALNATRRARPDQVFPFFLKCLGREPRPETVLPKAGVRPIRTSGEPY